MSVEKTIAYNGFMTFWSLTDGTNSEVLRDALNSINKASLLPSTQDESQALRRSIASHFPKRSYLIRELDEVCGFGVIEEDRTLEQLEYQEVLRVIAMGDMVVAAPQEHPAIEHIKQEFLFQKKLITASALGGMLVNACRQLNGISLRPRGGLYWVPEESRESWEAICDAVESCGGNRVFELRTTTDAKTVDAVCDLLVLQVEKKLETLEEDLQEGNLQQTRAIESRRDQAQELDALLSTYEGILGRTLKELRERSEEVEEAACTALLLASVAV